MMQQPSGPAMRPALALTRPLARPSTRPRRGRLAGHGHDATCRVCGSLICRLRVILGKVKAGESRAAALRLGIAKYEILPIFISGKFATV